MRYLPRLSAPLLAAACAAGLLSAGVASAAELTYTFKQLARDLCVNSASTGVCKNKEGNAVGVLPHEALSQTASFLLVPGTLSFGTTSVGPLGAQVTNTSQTTITVTGVTTDSAFSAAHNCATLAPGATCNINVSFLPTAAQEYTGALSVAVAGVASQTASLSGTGVFKLTPSAQAISMGTVTTATSGTQQVTLTNEGTLAADLNFDTVSAPFALTHNCGASLTALRSCTLTFSYTPSTAGTHSQTVTLHSTDNLSFTLSGSATYPAAKGSITTLTNTANALSTDNRFIGITPVAAPVANAVYPYDGTNPGVLNVVASAAGAFSTTPVSLGNYTLALFPVDATHAIQVSGTNLMLRNLTGGNLANYQTYPMGASTPAGAQVVRDPYSNYYYLLFTPTAQGQPTMARFNVAANNTIANVSFIGSWTGGSYPVVGYGFGAAMSPDGHVYFVTTAGAVHRLNATTGVLSDVPSLALPNGYSYSLVTLGGYGEDTSGIAFDGLGNALRLANNQVLKYPNQGNGQFGTPTPIVGTFNTAGQVDGAGQSARIDARTVLRQGPDGTAWLVKFKGSAGDYGSIRQVR